MTRGRAALAAVVGLAAFGAAGGAYVTGRDAREEGARVGTGARESAEAARAASFGELEREVAAAAAIPEIGAAIHNKVDAFTLEDLFQSEDWWASYRARAVAIVGPSGPLVSRGAPGGLAAPELVARARTGAAASGAARAGESDYLVAAAAITVPDQPGWTLLLGRPIDAALVAEWAGRAGAGLLLSNGRAPGLSASAPPDAAAALVGHESEASVVGPGGNWVAAALPVRPGLWLWTTRPLTSGARGQKLWGLAAVLAGLAIVLAATGRRRQVEPASASPTGMPVSRVAPLPRSNPGLSTQIASSEGQVFGRYTVLERLGEGGMCDVFTAALTGPEGFQRTFALKRLKPELARNRAAVDQFIDEAKLGSTLVHSNIVPVYDFGKVGDGYFIAQEYIVGRNLGQLLARHNERLGEHLDLPTIFYIVFETLQALAYAHDKTNEEGAPLNLVHRDVSPGNIIVSRGGEVKLIDFGITKAEGRVSKTDTGNVKGNAAFMSPEQARGVPVDRRADLFSLGVVMYGALANEPFYRGNTVAEVFYNAGVGPTSEHAERIERLATPAAAVLSRALAPKVDDRYPSAEEMAADIAPYVPADSKGHLARLMAALFGDELRRPSGAAGGSGSGGERAGVGQGGRK